MVGFLLFHLWLVFPEAATVVPDCPRPSLSLRVLVAVLDLPLLLTHHPQGAHLKSLWGLDWELVEYGVSLSGSRGLTASLVTYSFDPCFLLWVSGDWGGYLRNWWQVLDISTDNITIWAITKLAEAFRFFNWSLSAVGVMWSVELTAPSILSSSLS